MHHLFKEFLHDIEMPLKSAPVNPDWVDDAVLHETYRRILDTFDVHYARTRDDMAYIFSAHDDVTHHTDKTVRLLEKWSRNDYPVSMAAVLAVAMDNFDFDTTYIKPLCMAAVLADVPNDQPYHNNLHFRKVVLHAVRMIAAHNMIFAGEKNRLDAQKAALLMISAAIHDLGHKGESNIIERKYHMARIEIFSFALSCPWLKAAGLPDDMLDDIRIMLIATDASPFGDPVSPTNQVRRAFEYHYGSAEEDMPLDLSGDLQILETRSGLCLLCMMLHEADIMNSAGVSYDTTREESISISREIGRTQALPEDTLLFLEKICAGRMLSDAARHLGNYNLQTILQRVAADYEGGNVSYV